jgi:hypothetical protein
MDDKFYVHKLDREYHPNDPHSPNVFYIDVGNMSGATAAKYLAEIKTEIQNRKLP